MSNRTKGVKDIACLDILFLSVFSALVAAAIVSHFATWFMILGVAAGSGAGVLAWLPTRNEPPILRVVAVVLLSAFWTVVGGFLLALLLFILAAVITQPSFGA
jgi:Trk-type K+ transport system membrane component